jgi:hypothetical protein
MSTYCEVYTSILTEVKRGLVVLVEWRCHTERRTKWPGRCIWYVVWGFVFFQPILTSPYRSLRSPLTLFSSENCQGSCARHLGPRIDRHGSVLWKNIIRTEEVALSIKFFVALCSIAYAFGVNHASLLLASLKRSVKYWCGHESAALPTAPFCRRPPQMP